MPIKVYAAESPTYADIPFWLTACVRLAPPLGRTGTPRETVDKVFPIAQAALADRMRVDQENVGLDRELISLIAGYATAKEGRWIVQYLQHIGFLRVRKNYEPGTGKRHPDTFIANTRPPLGYVGPMNYADLADALRSTDPAARVLFVDSDGNRSAKPRNAHASVGSEAYERTGVSRGQNRSAKPRNAHASVAEREREGTPSREFPPSIDRKTASPPAVGGAGGEPPQATEDALTVVRRLPWPRGKRPTRRQAEKLAREIDAATERAGLTHSELHDHLAERVPRAHSNPMTYALNALADDELPISGADEQDDRHPASDDSADVTPKPPQRPACEACGAHEGDGPAERFVWVDANTGRPCECRKAAV